MSVYIFRHNYFFTGRTFVVFHIVDTFVGAILKVFTNLIKESLKTYQCCYDVKPSNIDL